MSRPLSHSELRSLTLCEAQWDFRYGGRLAGTCLKPKVVTPRMRAGRAWGRAVARWHMTGGDLVQAQLALMAALDEDAAEQRAAGVFDPDSHLVMVADLDAVLTHYAATAAVMPLTDPEFPFDVVVNDGFRLTGFLDGLMRDDDGVWIVEFKLRGELTSYEMLALDRQGLRYAWAYEALTGTAPVGVIYDERLNDAPRAPKILKSGKPSVDKSQKCTAEAYVAACEAAGYEPDADAVTAYRARPWQHRQRIMFRGGELDDSDAEVYSLAQKVSELESGRLPVRVSHRAICGGCAFRNICPDPADAETVDALFARVPPKRDRPKEPVTS